MSKNNPHDVVCGKRLRECREEKGLTQAELAEAVYNLPENRGKERSGNQIGYMERGDRAISLEYAALLSRVLDVRAEYLLGKDDFKNALGQLQNAIEEMNREGNLLYTGLVAFGELAGYSIKMADIYGGKTLKEIFSEIKSGCKISKGEETISLSLEEMNQFENEVLDFVELKFRHLFKQKGVKNNG